jgi:hypothetical protein
MRPTTGHSGRLHLRRPPFCTAIRCLHLRPQRSSTRPPRPRSWPRWACPPACEHARLRATETTIRLASERAYFSCALTRAFTLFMCVLWCDQVWSADPSHMTQSLGLHESGDESRASTSATATAPDEAAPAVRESAAGGSGDSSNAAGAEVDRGSGQKRARDAHRTDAVPAVQ